MSSGSRSETSRTGSSRDDGAAAVEFALLFPIFAILVFGGLSLGIIYWHSINAAQGARDAARYGATLPISLTVPPPTGEYSMAQWLTLVSDVALNEAGVGDSTGDGVINAADMAEIDAYLCVAFVKGAASTHTQATTSKVVSAATGPATTAPCVASDGAPAAVDRVQVVFKRDEYFNAALIWKNITTETKSVQPYQRTIK